MKNAIKISGIYRYIKTEYILVLLFISLYTLAAVSVSLNRFWQYNAFWFDFGIFDSTVFQLSRFKLPIIAQLSPPEGRVAWAEHFNPSTILIAPLYWLTSKAEIMLIAQAVAVGASAVVAYIISRKVVKNGFVRAALIASYLGFVGLQNALYTDVHNIVFAMLPLMLCIWAFYRKKWTRYWLFLIMTVGFQESLALVAVMLGVFMLLRKDRQVKIGTYTIFFGLIYGFLTMKLVIPFFKGGGYKFQPDLPAVWYEWLTRFIFPVNLKLRTILLTFATFGFLPLGNLATWPLIAEHYLERFVLNSAATRWDLGFHYNALLSPIMFLASVEAIILIQQKKSGKRLLTAWGILTIFTVIFLHRFYLHGPLMLATHPVFYEQTKNASFLDYFVSQIPREGRLMTQNNIGSFFTHGNTILLDSDYAEIKPDTIAVDLREGQNANNFYPISFDDAKKLAASVSADPNYSKRLITDSQLIFSRTER